MGEFHGWVRGESTDDPAEWPALVKANPPVYARGSKPVRVSKQQPREYAHPARVTLTKVEKEWLGATVRRSDGLVGQVWCLGWPATSETPDGLWLAADGQLHEATTANVTRVEP